MSAHSARLIAACSGSIRLRRLLVATVSASRYAKSYAPGKSARRHDSFPSSQGWDRYAEDGTSMTSTHDFTATTADGKEVPLSDYAGKVLLIVNVASKCGLTPQYEGLESLYRDEAGRGLEILGFPCNQFKGQEPGTNEEIQDFCKTTY